MRTLEQALFDHELIVLRVLGEWLDLDLTGADKQACVSSLSVAFQKVNLALEKQYLPPEESAAVEALVTAGGRLPVATFAREFGDVRLMGPARLEREEPWYEPASPAEALWYRGFIYRAFEDLGDGLVEYYYLPTDFLAHFPEALLPERAAVTTGRFDPVSAPRKYPQASTELVDDVTTILLLAQAGRLATDTLPEPEWLLVSGAARVSMAVQLALDARLIKKTERGLRPASPAVNWLKDSREGQLRALAETWSVSVWNDLHHVPSILCEGSGWSNDPILARSALLDTLPRSDEWFAVDDIVSFIRETTPDFQRPDGDYDSWYIRDRERNVYLRGFDHWDAVEGALLRFLLKGPLFWLGMVEGDNQHVHLTARGLAWLQGGSADDDEPKVPLHVDVDGRIVAQRRSNRYERFQASRVADALPPTDKAAFQYRLSPASLKRAVAQGITPQRVLQFLNRVSGNDVPVSVRRGIERWEQHGVEARLQPVILLRVRDPEILDKLRANSKTQPYIGESMGDMAVIVRRQDWEALQQASAQLGLLLDDSEIA